MFESLAGRMIGKKRIDPSSRPLKKSKSWMILGYCTALAAIVLQNEKRAKTGGLK